MGCTTFGAAAYSAGSSRLIRGPKLTGKSEGLFMTERDAKREGWTAEELGEQSSYEGETEMGRRLRRGDETVGDADARDVAGGGPLSETPEARGDKKTLRRAPGETPT